MNHKIFTLGLFVLFTCSLLAQEKRSIGFAFSAIGANYVINSAGTALEGEADYEVKHFITLGVSYIHPVRSWIGIESGVEYSNYTITIKPMAIPGTDLNFSKYNKELSLISVPVSARINFLKYFFANGGVLLDLETANSTPIESQTGLGLLFGIGAKYNFNNGFGVFVNGYNKHHALIPFSAKMDDYRWRLLEFGLRAGVTYNF